ncbi:putative secreted protein (Por secretion system target), partial [Salegentibacter sp. 24]|uniref:LamG-like jellyroll fold domain-containing protein n=1 Tax=Salegentibacter sp. 24 TaxID=2183986 RepID=UPI001061F144
FVEDTSDGNSNPEVITRTYSVTDDANNSINVTQTITVDDTQLPTASSPAPVTVQCAADIPDPDITVVTDEADNCTTNPIVHFVEDTSDGNSNPEVITRTYSVTDDANNSINVTQTITVNDTQDPAIPELPTLTSECSLTVIPPTTTDNCDNIITGTTGITDLTFESSETIIWIFTDEAGNSTGPVEQEIIINNIAPVPDDETLPTKTIEGCQISSIEDLDIPTATDCEGQISGTLSDDFVFPYIFSGTQTIEWQFIDSQGNISTQEQEITLIPENVEGGTLTGTFESTDFENQIDISSCEEQISVELQLTGEIGTIIQWEKFAVNEGNWEVISDNDNFYTATFPVGALESTYYRVLIQVGTCTEYSDDFYIRALPTGAAPTVTNLDPEKQYCLGDKVNLLATSNYLGTQNAIPDSPGDFNEGQLNTKDLDSWLVDGKVGNFTAGGNAKKPRNWSGTNNHDFGGIEYDSQDGKFAIAQGNFYEVDKNGKSNYDGNIPTTLESPITDFSNAESATIDFDQAFYFANDDVAVIEISFDGGQNYETLQVLHAKGDGIKAWYNGQAGSSTSEYNFHNDNTSISLENYFDGRDLSSVRIRWSFTGTSDQSVWAMDNIFLNKKIPVQTDVEWTEGIGDPDEDPIVTGTTEAPISFIADTPGVHQYGGTALVNGCRTYSEEGTGLIEIPVSYAYAGEDIIFTPEECGQNTVQLNAYDNTKTANENISKKAYPSPPPGCTSCDAPGTQENGTWSWSRQEGTSLCITESFSNVNDPDATFTAGPGLYTLTWTLDNGCSSTISVEITECKQIDFDGIDDHVDFNDNYDLLGAFSLEVWVRPESIDGTRTIISKRDVNFSDTAKGYDLRITDGIVSFNWDKSGTINSSPYKIDTNRWYHIALTHSESGEYKIYVDGLLIKTVGGVSPGENSFSAILGTMDNNDSGVSSNHFNGWMDEIRIWNVELKPDQLHLMMNQRIEKVATNTITGEVLPLNIPEVEWNNLVGYYRMNDIACGNVQAYNNIGFSGKLKNITSSQERTAPLPYISEGAGTWHNRSTWDPSSTKFWTFPHDTGINGKPILWNIAKQNHDISSNNKDIKLLGLFSADQKQLVMNGEINNSGNELRITHYLELDGKIDLNGESQLVQTEGSILAEESSGIIERAQQGTANSFNYNYWTSPASPRGTSNNAPYTIKGVLKDGTTKDPQDISFGYDHTHADGNYSGNKRISTYWLYKFHGDANSYGHWRWIGHTGELKTGEGFTMKGTSGAVDIATQQNYIFLGKPHNGTITLNISNQENRLVGNPYPSAIDADQFIRDNLRDVDGGTRLQNVFNGALYFWDHFGFENSHVLREYVGGYATYTLAGGVRAASTDSRINATGDTGEKEPGRYIPVAQGFFVNSVLDDALSGNYTIDGGDITFKNSQRVFVKEASGNSQFLKPENLVKGKAKVEQAKFTADTRYKIRLNFNSPKGYHRQILVTADARTTNHFDLGYDAPLIDDNAEDMFWLVEKSEFVIQAVPDFNVDQKLPIGLKIAEEKEFSIEIGELENLPDHVNIYLLNTSDSTYHDLRKEAFKASLPAGEYMDLYEIVFHDVTSSREGKEPGQGPIDYLYSLENNEFIISNPELHKIDHINIYNIAGQLVDQHYGIPDIKEIHIPQKKSLSSGVYIVKIYTSIGDYAKKVIIRNN